MDKIIAIKVKNSSGTYDEIPITALAQNVYWNSNLDLNLKQHIIGDIDSVKDSNQNIVPLQTQINNLNNKKADINSPIFTGNPKIKVGNQNLNVATENFVQGQIVNNLTKNDLQTASLSIREAKQPSSEEDRQYPITFDSENNLSVNVPWTDTIFSSSIENIWTGVCEVENSYSTKIINLDNTSDFPLDSDSLTGNEILAIYFKNNNTASNPTIKINDVEEYPIGFINKNGNIQLITNVSPFYNFGSGLKFFVYKKNYDQDNNNCWLLSNVDFSIISYLNNNKANLNSPEFTGIPKAPSPSNGDNNPDRIATISFVRNQIEDQLKIGDLQKGRTATSLHSSEPSSVSDRQYPVVFDAENKLSVNVPWNDSGAIVKNVSNLWTGFTESRDSAPNKRIVLNNDDISDGYGGLINFEVSSQGELISIVEKVNILIYFKEGNKSTSPTITISFRENDITKDILYQTGTNTYSKLENDSLYYQWGPGLKLFTYIKYKDEDDIDRDGWLISSFDAVVIKTLNQKISTLESQLENKANKISPNLEGVPTTPIPNGIISDQITNVNYVKSECSKILNSNEDYAFQLKGKNSNQNIFAVDWNGKANGVDLNCITTDGIVKTRPETTIIGQYNKLIKNVSGLFCGEPDSQPKCRDTLMVGGSDIAYDSGNYAFVIGNGTDNENRSNVLTVNWNGAVLGHNYSSIANNVDLTITPDQSVYETALALMDCNGTAYGNVGHASISDGRKGILIQADKNNITNALYLLINSDGSANVAMTQPQAWRNALGFEKKVLIGPSKIWNGVTIIVYSVGNVVTCTVYGAENGNWNGGAVNAFYTLPVGYRPHSDINQIFTDQNNKRMIWVARGNGQIGLYWLLDSITSKTNVYGTVTWTAWQ